MCCRMENGKLRMENGGRAVIISAPSGAGKSTLIRLLMKSVPELAFSVSACTRPMRPGETDGVDYFFLPAERFREHISQGDFVEWEEVYEGSYYGTLKSEMERIWSAGRFPLFEVDIKGGLSLKKYFGANSLSVFISPPSLEILEKRLRDRATDPEESLLKRIGKAEYEMSFAGNFDRVIVNDDLGKAALELIAMVREFLWNAERSPEVT